MPGDSRPYRQRALCGSFFGAERRDSTPEDWQDVHAYASQPEAYRFQAWGPNTPDASRAYVEEVIALAQARPRTGFHQLGMQYEGWMHEILLTRDGRRDLVLYNLLEHEWQPERLDTRLED